MSMERTKAAIGFVGLGHMGKEAVRSLLDKGIKVAVFNRTKARTDEMVNEGAIGAYSIRELCEMLSPPRLVWLMVAAGKPVDEMLFGEYAIVEHLQPGDIVIDGGNSFFRDSMRRAAELKKRGIFFLDCGSSGGLEGARHGMCLMVGGEREAFEKAEHIFRLLACEGGYAHVGPSGAGHFVKMVHNAIEYGILQAIGEGFELLAHGGAGDGGKPLFPELDLPKIAELWCHGSVIRGWLMELLARALDKDPKLKSIKGIIGGGATGSWAIEEAWKAGVPFPIIAMSYALRLRSRQDDTFAGKVVAALRYEFGGHETVPSEQAGEQVSR